MTDVAEYRQMFDHGKLLWQKVLHGPNGRLGLMPPNAEDNVCETRGQHAGREG